MSYQVHIREEKGIVDTKGKRFLYFYGVDFGAPLEILEETDKAVLVWQKGHSSYLDRMSGSKYYSPNYRVFLYTIPQKEILDYSTGLGRSFEIEYQGKKKQVRTDAENQAREWFKRANKGEFDVLVAPRQDIPKPVAKTASKELGKALWKAIQSAQGYAFISDSCEDMTDAEVLKLAKAALRWEQKCVNILTEFMEKYGGNNP